MVFQRSESPRWVLLSLVTLCYACVGLSVGLIPAAVHQGGGNDRAVGFAMGAYAFSAILARVVLGNLMEVWGYRKTLALSAAILAVSTALCAIPQTTTIIGARLLLGCGVGGMMAAATAWAVELPSATGKMGPAIGSVGTVNYVVLALFAPVGTVLQRCVGSTFGFVIAAVFPVAALLALGAVKAPPTPQRARQNPHDRDTSHDDRHVGTRIARAVTVPGLALLCSGFGYAALVSFGAQLAQSSTLKVASYVVLIYGASMVAGRVLLSPASDRLRGRRYTAGSFIIEGLGLLCVSLATNSWTFTLGVIAVGLGMALIYPLLGAQVGHAAGPSLRGRALSWYGAFINLGIGMGSFIVGLAANAFGLRQAFVLAAAVTLVGALLASLTKDEPPAP